MVFKAKAGHELGLKNYVELRVHPIILIINYHAFYKNYQKSLDAYKVSK